VAARIKVQVAGESSIQIVSCLFTMIIQVDIFTQTNLLMNSSVPDGDGSPVYTKDVHTPQVARQPQCKLDFQVDSRQALSEHAYIQQSQRYIEEEHSVHLCTHVV